MFSGELLYVQCSCRLPLCSDQFTWNLHVVLLIMLSLEESRKFSQDVLKRLNNSFPGLVSFSNALEIPSSDSVQNITGYLCLIDVTDGHTVDGVGNGRALKAEGLEYFLVMVTDSFKSKSRVLRHQMITKLFQEELINGEIHSIQIKAWTTEEWRRKGAPTQFKNKPCTVLAN